MSDPRPAFWLLAGLALALIAALWMALRRLYQFEIEAGAARRSGGGAIGGSPRPGDLAELSEILAALQEYGISKPEEASRGDFGRLLLEHACRVIGASGGALLAFDEATGTLTPVAGWPDGSPGPGGAGALAERAYRTGAEASAATPRGTRLSAIPLRAQRSVLGSLVLETAVAPSEAVLRLLAPIAGEAAAVLNRFSLFDNLQGFHLEMVETLYRAANAFDPHAREHAALTRERARRLGVALGLPEPMVRHVEYAALLRGVGKLGVDQAILNKPGKLTPAEYDAIKRYTTIGHQILSQARLLVPAAKMVLHHQEWWDGRGYPEGLKGEAIPLGARIISVISAWEAMTSDRPYRRALSTEAALAELERSAGSQFDPAVVAAYRKLVSGPAAAGAQPSPPS